MNILRLTNLPKAKCRLTVMNQDECVVDEMTVKRSEVIRHAYDMATKHSASIDRQSFRGYA